MISFLHSAPLKPAGYWDGGRVEQREGRWGGILQSIILPQSIRGLNKNTLFRLRVVSLSAPSPSLNFSFFLSLSFSPYIALKNDHINDGN